MDDETADRGTVPLGGYPNPVCRYAFEDGRAVVEDVDAAFESRFGAVDPGTELADAFDALGFDVDDLIETLRAGGVTVSRVRDEAFRARHGSVSGDYALHAIPPDGDGAGALLVSELSDRESEPTLGVNHVASVVSHDLRNPLDVAKAHLRASREGDDPEGDDHLQRVARAHQRMERIIEDVLTLARGEEVVEPQEGVDLEVAAEAAWETVDTGDATLVVAEQLPTAVADPDRVQRLFENLFRNCIEHGTSEQDGAVRVTVGRLEEPAGFYVADDGVGVPEPERERVFDPGYSSDEHGTGLGLAIVARIADVHGWSRAITTTDSGGTRVEIRDVEPVE